MEKKNQKGIQWFRQAQTIDDLKTRMQWIETNYQDIGDRIREYNKFLKVAWKSPIRHYDDDDFDTQIIQPLKQVYEDAVHGVEELEALTGRRRRSK